MATCRNIWQVCVPELTLMPRFNLVNQVRSSSAEWKTYYSVGGDAKSSNPVQIDNPSFLHPAYLCDTIATSSCSRHYLQSSALALQFVKPLLPFLQLFTDYRHHFQFHVLKWHPLSEMRHAAWMVGCFAHVHHTTITAYMCFNSHCNMQCLLACNKYTVFLLSAKKNYRYKRNVNHFRNLLGYRDGTGIISTQTRMAWSSPHLSAIPISFNFVHVSQSYSHTFTHV